MDNFEGLSIEVNTGKQILSSETKIYKTERFFYQTKKLSGIDKFILKISESLLGATSEFYKKYAQDKNINSFKVETFDKSFSFLMRFGFQINDAKISNNDIVFFFNETNLADARTNDQRILLYLKSHRIFSVIIKPTNTNIQESDFKKLYVLSNAEFVNIPMLNDKQEKLVKIENKNLLVQGVAGSGKTNICLSKIIYTACKNYTGKILYTTFSRGLLLDTKTKIEMFKINIKNLIDDYKNNRIIFLDKDHKKAIENRLGIYIFADNETNIIRKLESIVSFLENNIDYYLIEDIYKQYFDEEFEMSNENIFINQFLKNVNNHQLKVKLEKIKNISYSIIYKEIYGMIFGCYNDGFELISLDEYIKRRENSFSKDECKTIYMISELFYKFQKTQNLIDNNEISRKILKNIKKLFNYSLSIIDEVQDFTEINLNLFKAISIKMFCVGDALQMINPSYFSFAYLKKLMYDKDVTDVEELESNYRNNRKIVDMLGELSEVNIEAFGTHSFVLNAESVDENSMTNAVFVEDENFIDLLKNQKFENFTIIVSDSKQKDKLRKIFKKQEILTVSEIKGLERDTVLLYNILSDNSDKWQRLIQININHKQADENSVYRYYFNLFYVGISRAKHNIFVFENNKINLFEDFFENNFEILDGNSAYQKFCEIISKIEIDDDEILERIDEFIKLEQFENARFYAEKFDNDYLARQQFEKIDAFENFVYKGKNKEAGIKLWKAGLTDEAKKQFAISGDKNLIDFIDQLQGKVGETLDADIVKFFVDFDENDDAQQLILEILKQDLENIRLLHKDTKNKLKEFKEKYNGK